MVEYNLSMAKQKTKYECTECGYEQVKWMGKCPQCNAWNTLTEVVASKPSQRGSGQEPIRLTDVITAHGGEVRLKTGFGELDTLLGGGLVSGSLTLIGGDPGVGKSTLLLMVAGAFAKRGLPVLYASGEESAQQIQLRAKRLGIHSETLYLLPTAQFEDIEAAAKRLSPVLVIVDSVQTVSVQHAQGHAGSVGQVRAVAHQAMVFAKKSNVATFLVGHITKSGDLAGPKIMEHFVDTVLYFEGDGKTTLRGLRTVKNRFGAAGELGFFEMSDSGLIEVSDASGRLLEESTPGVPGTAVVATIEGSRPLLAEIQALVGPPGNHSPARTCVGADRSRLLMILAVLQKHGINIHDRNVFVNVTGGLQISEPAADLAIALAIHSSYSDQAVPEGYLVLGEVGLVGEIRSVSQPTLRMKEAARYGFKTALTHRNAQDLDQNALDVVGVRSFREVLAHLHS